ncbi:solute carrier family 22 member 7-like isoform X2 [Dermacentor albipictus]|uniref:solute carrier family 22 member 7-like isoform X2 n=1 Tax=Dermacentor albipictus TaxID=60249 RepID=UPI0031FCD743
MAWETVPTVGIPEALTESGPVLTNFHRPEDTKEAVERALYAILGHGAFQRRIMACSLLSMVVLLCHSLAYRAIASPVDHWCARPAAFGAMPVPLWRNVAIPVESDGSFSQCTVYEPPVPADDALDHTRHAVPCESWEYATAFRNRSIVSEWDLVCERRRLVQLSSAAYMAGAMLCVPIVGLLSDRTGRKPVITGSVSALILAAIVCSTTHSFVVFVLSRMVVSAMSSAAQVLSFILLYEVTGPDRRAAYALLATGTGIMLMPVVLELLAAAQFSWPATQLLLLMPTVSLVYSHYLLEESPSWLLATWRLKRAEEALLVAARRNGLVVEKAARFFRKLKAEMRRHAHAHLAATAAEAIRSDANKTAGSDSMVAEFLSGRRAVSVFLAWFTVMFCFYGIQLADQDLDGGVDAWLRWDDVAYVVTLAPLIAGTYAGLIHGAVHERRHDGPGVRHPGGRADGAGAGGASREGRRRQRTRDRISLQRQHRGRGLRGAGSDDGSLRGLGRGARQHGADDQHAGAQFCAAAAERLHRGQGRQHRVGLGWRAVRRQHIETAGRVLALKSDGGSSTARTVHVLRGVRRGAELESAHSIVAPSLTFFVRFIVAVRPGTMRTSYFQNAITSVPY